MVGTKQTTNMKSWDARNSRDTLSVCLECRYLRVAVLRGQRNKSRDKALLTPSCVVFKARLERRSFRIVGDGNYPPGVPISDGITARSELAQ